MPAMLVLKSLCKEEGFELTQLGHKPPDSLLAGEKVWQQSNLDSVPPSKLTSRFIIFAVRTKVPIAPWAPFTCDVAP